MTNKIVLKKSAVTGKVPLASDLDYGELALNYADGKLYYKSVADAINEISGGSDIPSGGTTNQVLTKVNSTDYNTQWSSLFVGGLTKIEVVSTLPGSPDSTTLYIVTA